jgi:hypothetical protein
VKLLFGAAHKQVRYLVLLGNHNLGVLCLRILHGFWLVLLFDGGLSSVILIEVGNIWCCSQISQIFGAAKKWYCFSLVLPDR